MERTLAGSCTRLTCDQCTSCRLWSVTIIEVAGNWELGWAAPITEIEHWGMAMRSFNVERLTMFPVTGIQCKFLDEYETVEEVLASKPHLTTVFVDENGETELKDFEHPEDALYVFGKANYTPFPTYGQDDLSVRIDCDLMGMLWPHQAMSIVLYDRASK